MLSGSFGWWFAGGAAVVVGPAAYARGVFAFEMQSWRRVRMRLGSWHFRTWRSYWMRLPRGYRSPETIYEVVLLAEDDNVVAQMGAFFDLRTAEACLARYEPEVREQMAINYVGVHSRLEDWKFDL
ncbi:hypothetical protein [Myceligenerans xiligouense]|uniref:Uncharacterized protein n=1 Tax=Myceligenerans xiligouense TaxID=253184 RepID=A0A3N4YLK2_9MICO|nr:hypothetical protein [Myceligenerans xiligouense]RPF20997.1 hypothetical protein EDD34_1606 [Myceligenerans xiligouense]